MRKAPKTVPHIEPPKGGIKRLKEEDKELWTKEKLKKDDQRFQKEASFLTRLLRRFKRL